MLMSIYVYIHKVAGHPVTPEALKHWILIHEFWVDGTLYQIYENSNTEHGGFGPLLLNWINFNTSMDK